MNSPAMPIAEGRAKPRWPRTAIAAAVTLMAVAAYWVDTLGSRPPDAQPTAAAEAESSSLTQMQDALEDSLKRPQVVLHLKQRLQQSPDDAAGWALLARTEVRLGHVDEAVAAFSRATALAPDDVDLLVDHADALALAQHQDLQGAPMDLIERALKLNPQHPGALSLSGLAAFDRQDYAAARQAWQAALAGLKPDDPSRARLQTGMAELDRRTALAHRG